MKLVGAPGADNTDRARVTKVFMARGGTPYNGLYGEAPPERGPFFRLQVYERVGISRAEVYERAGKSVI